MNSNPPSTLLAGKRICVVTAGHLSTCPRMLKAADAFAEAGSDVHVVSTSWMEWAKAGDAEIISRRPGKWKWSVVKWDRASAPARNFWSAMRHRLTRGAVNQFGPRRVSLRTLGAAQVRMNPELAVTAARVDCEFFYGGGGALAATALAAERRAVPFALDLEDFHSGEHDDSPDGQVSRVTVEEIERRMLGRAAFLTAGSGAIAEAYREKYGVNPLVVNNTFPLPPQPPEFKPFSSPAVRLYWFSQTIGAGRGLEEVVHALGMADIPAELHLRGRPANGYLEGLQSLTAGAAPKTKIIVHEPSPPDEMVALAGDFEVGLAVEQTQNFNKRICLTNKAFTYVLAGLAVVFTDTPGQRALAHDLGAGALLYRPGDVAALAKGLRIWASDKSVLLKARQATWEAAQRRWHWEHASERGILLEAAVKVLRRN